MSRQPKGDIDTMSHIVQIQTKVYDESAVVAACRRLALAEPEHGTAELFSGTATGLLVQFPDWKYPAVIDTATGTVRFDNYGGCWGDQCHLDQFVQMYAVEKAKIEGRKRGHTVSERTLDDGSILVRVQVGS
jgi:hypothetical protein